ncbi:Bud-site selection protein [Viridothelium virens]|uniref:Bud-site selection protein n=1 Tax=Viridothelium virens TaxID=1048519 RepID=A0A6A6HNC7_VIRVR|nr:Bud-site selection protein [Viridothelium virens]
MPKRKRSSHVGQEPITDPTQRQKNFTAQIIAQQAKDVSRAMKAGKGFERQKLAKRYKAAEAKGDNDVMRRLESEVEALKALDLHSVASHHLHKSLLKVKAIASSPGLPFGFQDVPQMLHDAATLNVAARLYSSNPVRTATGNAVNEVTRALGIGASTSRAKSKTSRSDKSGDSMVAPVEGASDRHALDIDEETSYHEGASTDHESDDVVLPLRSKYADDSMDEDEHENLAKFEDRLASASDESDVGDDSHQDTPQRSSPNADHVLADLSVSSSSPAPSSPREVPPASSKATKSIKPNKSAFLPSLTMGGYISGSESGSEDDLDVTPARRNRRGQRARQQIWEAKYGNNANHLQKQKQNDKRGDRNKGWDPRRGAVEERGSTFPNWKREKGGAQELPTGANATQRSNSTVRSNDRTGRLTEGGEEGSLHPSWEAKRKAKEQQKHNAAFQGKKITFD